MSARSTGRCFGHTYCCLTRSPQPAWIMWKSTSCDGSLVETIRTGIDTRPNEILALAIDRALAAGSDAPRLRDLLAIAPMQCSARARAHAGEARQIDRLDQ